MKKTIMFIHGAFMTPLRWGKFFAFFESKDYKCFAPAWPHRDKPIDSLRNNPPDELARLGVQEIFDHYEKAVRSIEEPPTLIGHSFGGLFVQSLLDCGLGRAAVGDPFCTASRCSASAMVGYQSEFWCSDKVGLRFANNSIPGHSS